MVYLGNLLSESFSGDGEFFFKFSKCNIIQKERGSIGINTFLPEELRRSQVAE